MIATAERPLISVHRGAVYEIPRHWIEVLRWPDGEMAGEPVNERRHFDPVALQELADSFGEHGVLQPPLVRIPEDAPSPESWTEEHHPLIELVAGERRFRATALAGLDALPCTVRRMSFEAAVEACVIENRQREDLTPIEEARSFRSWLLLGGKGRTQRALAERIGVSQELISKRLRLLDLPEPIQALVDASVVGPSQAYEFLVPFVGLRADLAAKLWEEVVRILRAREEGRPWGNRDLEAEIARVAHTLSRALDPAGVGYNDAAPAFDVASHEACDCGGPLYRYSATAYGHAGTRAPRCFDLAWWDARQAEARAAAEREREAQLAAARAKSEEVGAAGVLTEQEVDAVASYSEREEIVGWSGSMHASRLYDPRHLPSESLVWVTSGQRQNPYLYCTDVGAARAARTAATRELNRRVKVAEAEAKERLRAEARNGGFEPWMLAHLLSGDNSARPAAALLGVNGNPYGREEWTKLPEADLVAIARCVALASRDRVEHGSIEDRIRGELLLEYSALLPESPTAQKAPPASRDWTPYIRVADSDEPWHTCDGCEDGTLYVSVCTVCRGQVDHDDCGCEDDGARFVCTACQPEECEALGLEPVEPSPAAAPGPERVAAGRAGLPTKRPASELVTTEQRTELRLLHVREAYDQVAATSFDVRQAVSPTWKPLRDLRRRYLSLFPYLWTVGVMLDELPDAAAWFLDDVARLIDADPPELLEADEYEEGVPRESTCRICGCTDARACDPPCSWLVVDREEGVGVCSAESCAARYHAELRDPYAPQEGDVAPGTRVRIDVGGRPREGWVVRCFTDARGLRCASVHDQPGASWGAPVGKVEILEAPPIALTELSRKAVDAGYRARVGGKGEAWHRDQWRAGVQWAELGLPRPGDGAGAEYQAAWDFRVRQELQDALGSAANSMRGEPRWAEVVERLRRIVERLEACETTAPGWADAETKDSLTVARRALPPAPEPPRHGDTVNGVRIFAPTWSSEISGRPSDWFDIDKEADTATCRVPGCGHVGSIRPAARQRHRAAHERRGEEPVLPVAEGAEEGGDADPGLSDGAAEPAVPDPVVEAPASILPAMSPGDDDPRAASILLDAIHGRDPERSILWGPLVRNGATDEEIERAVARILDGISAERDHTVKGAGTFRIVGPGHNLHLVLMPDGGEPQGVFGRVLVRRIRALLSIPAPAAAAAAAAEAPAPEPPAPGPADTDERPVATPRARRGRATPTAIQADAFAVDDAGGTEPTPRWELLDHELLALCSRATTAHRQRTGRGSFHAGIGALADGVRAYVRGGELSSLARAYDTPAEVEARQEGWDYAAAEHAEAVTLQEA